MLDMRRRILKSASATLVLLAAWAPVSPALSDAIVLPGTVCFQTPNDTAAWVRGPTSQQGNVLAFNNGGPPINIRCPLVRHNGSSTTGLSGLKVRVRAQSGITCIAQSYSSLGTPLMQSPPLRTVLNPGTLMDFGNSLSVSEPDGSYMILCNAVPGGAGIVSIRYWEN